MIPPLRWLPIAGAWWALVPAMLPLRGQSTTPSPEPAFEVRVESGLLRGTRFGEGQNERMFLGIPYAAPPTGSRRWKPPGPPEPWIGVRDATAFGASCPQKPTWAAEGANFYAAQPGLKYFAGFHTSEDCLFLNVWSTHVAGTKPLPVIVWFHGGANKGGSGALAAFGPVLARRGVVFVSFNYRLGHLGFFSHPALTAESPHHASGNYALMDQIAALAWVQRNIAAFGGDPRNVTAMGESAGGVDISLLMVSPLARGLFQRAIVQSNSCADYLVPELSQVTTYYGGTDSGESLGVRLAQHLGVDEGPEALARLRAKTVEEIVNAPEADGFYDGMVDGQVIPEQPAVAFAAGRQAKLPLLLGSNADEAALFASEAPATIAGYQDALRKDLHEDWKTIFDAYPAASAAEVPKIWQEMQTDFYFGVSMHILARAQRRIGQPVHYYFFTYPSWGGPFKGRAYHGFELWFLANVFGAPPDASALKLVEAMGEYWTRFVATGDPNGPNLPRWPEYDSKTNQVLELGAAVRLIDLPRVNRYEIFAGVLEKKLAERMANRTPPAK